ncbi:MAG TPA: glycosyltransferase family 9 protein, partial [Candidatus Kapabacteria bacterium]|nr:glycosyltransferase family 9 protein [Candidatus Kapabacteria bacterium]
MGEKIQIRCNYALGDAVVLTAAIRDLARSYPGRFDLSMETSFPEVWWHNPYVQRSIFPGKVIDCSEATIDHPRVFGRHYVHAYLNLLNEKLGTKAELSAIEGDIHLSEQERSWYSDIWSLCGREIPYWLICPGGKFDLPIKWWDHRRYQAVVDALRGKIQFVQVGWWGNHHPRLEGVIDLRGKTSIRDLIHLVHHADGVLSGVTSLMHLAAAVPMRDVTRTAVIVAGDREPKAWEAYPGHVYLTAGREMSCGSCWNNRVAESQNATKGVCTRVANGLPECLDSISEERVIETFENLRSAGRIRYARGIERQFVKKAIDVARERNDFDLHNIHEKNANTKTDEFLATLPKYPPGSYDGRGIVICAGTVSYFAQAWVCLRMLRQLGCTLPVEVWHFGEEELDRRMAALLAPLNVQCVNARERMKMAPMRNPLGWELKCYSVLYSKFQEVLSLDADNVPIVNPTFLFDTTAFHEKGAIFWPDYGTLAPSRSIWKICGVPYRKEAEFESGQMVINKEKCWRAQNLAWWYNDHSELFYRHIHGDKDTFHMAWRRTRTDYAMVPYSIESLEGVMCQHDFHGRRIFQHRNSHKWSFFGENKRIAGFKFEEDCLRHLEELRRIW